MKNLCPNCGSNAFKAIIKKASAIQIGADGAKILKEAEKFNYEVVECVKCATKLTNDDLVEKLGVKCSQCGKLTPEEDIVDGICPVCNALKNRTDLANATQEELISKLLQLEKQLNSTEAKKIDKKVESQEKAEDVAKKKKEEAQKKRAETLAKKKAAEKEKKKQEEEAQKNIEPPILNIDPIGGLNQDDIGQSPVNNDIGDDPF